MAFLRQSKNDRIEAVLKNKNELNFITIGRYYSLAFILAFLKSFSGLLFPDLATLASSDLLVNLRKNAAAMSGENG